MLEFKPSALADSQGVKHSRRDLKIVECKTVAPRCITEQCSKENTMKPRNPFPPPSVEDVYGQSKTEHKAPPQSRYEVIDTHFHDEEETTDESMPLEWDENTMMRKRTLKDIVIERNPLFEDQMKGPGKYPSLGYKILFVHQSQKGLIGVLGAILTGTHTRCIVYLEGRSRAMKFKNYKEAITHLKLNIVTAKDETEVKLFETFLWNADEDFFRNKYLKNKFYNGTAQPS